MSLPTNLKDDILNQSVNTHRRYNIKKQSDGSTVQSDVYLEDITSYSQRGSEVGATLLNNICQQLTPITKAQYDALTTKEDRLYIIVG